MTFLASTVLAPPFGLARFVGPPYCWSKTVKWVMSQVRIARRKTYSVFSFLLPNATSCLGIANRVPSAFLQFESACNLTSKDFWKVSVHWTFPWFYFSFLILAGLWEDAGEGPLDSVPVEPGSWHVFIVTFQNLCRPFFGIIKLYLEKISGRWSMVREDIGGGWSMDFSIKIRQACFIAEWVGKW